MSTQQTNILYAWKLENLIEATPKKKINIISEIAHLFFVFWNFVRLFVCPFGEVNLKWKLCKPTNKTKKSIPEKQNKPKDYLTPAAGAEEKQKISKWKQS